MNQRIAKKIVKAQVRGDRCCRRSRFRSFLFGRGGYSRHQVNTAIATLCTERLRKIIEVPVQGSLWGQSRTFTPVLISERFGDSRRLMYLSPINDRPAYFVVRVPGRSDPFDYIDDVYDAAEEEHGGASECETCGHYVTECDEECCFRERHFPNANFSDGSTWSFEP